MKILIAAHTCPQSGVIGTSRGISKYIYNISRELFRLGEDVTLLVRDDYKPEESWIKTIPSPKFSWMAYHFSLYKHMRNATADVYFSDYITTGAALAAAKKTPRAVSVLDAVPWMKNNNMTLQDRIADAWIKRCFKLAKNSDVLIALSNTARQDILNSTNLRDEQVKVIYCGVDQGVYRPIKHEPNGKVKIGYFGGFDGRKNAELVVKSFAQLSKKRSDIELHMVGSGRNTEIFRSMNIPNTYFQSPLPDSKMVEFINSLDIFVYPTLAEGFGLPIVEAMACGVPVIASNVTTMPEVVGKYGILTYPDVEHTSEAIEKLVDDEKLRKRYAELSLERASQLSWKNAGLMAQKVLSDLCKKEIK